MTGSSDVPDWLEHFDPPAGHPPVAVEPAADPAGPSSPRSGDPPPPPANLVTASPGDPSLLAAGSPWDCLSNSGPFRRVYTLRDRTGPVNWMDALVRLPAADEVGNLDSDELPYVYVGGWGPLGQGHVDAGFQYGPRKADWAPFVRYELAGGGSRQLPDPSGPPCGRVDGGSFVYLVFQAFDNEVVFDSYQVTGPGEHRPLARLPASLAPHFGWRASGAGLTFKRMTSIGQDPVTFEAKLPSRDSFVTRANWYQARLGLRADGESRPAHPRPWTPDLAGACNYPPRGTPFGHVVREVAIPGGLERNDVDFRRGPDPS